MIEKSTKEAFRSVFKVLKKDALNWFPGHMDKGLKQISRKLNSVDCIIQVHDARIPLSGSGLNRRLQTIFDSKPHILVLNKVDLIEPKLIPKIEKNIKDMYSHVVFTNCKDQHCKGLKSLFPLAQKLIKNSGRYNRSGEEDGHLMIIGVPNVGKSSLINALRAKNLHKGKATAVGAVPGITRSVLHKIKICDKPLFYMLDTPGILQPNIDNTEVGLKLALCNTIKDHLVGNTVIADYLLYWLNKNQHFKYVEVFKLNKATDNILEVLAAISTNEKKLLRIRTVNNEIVYKPDFEWAAQAMLKAFRNGNLGFIMLDSDIL